MTKDAENIDKMEQTPTKTPATGFYGHDDVNSYLEDQKKLEETAQQHQQTTDMMDRLAEEEDARRKEQQKQTADTENNNDTEQPTEEPQVQAAGSNPPPTLEELLCQLYSTSYLSELYVDKLNDFSLVRAMPDKDDKDKLAMVAVKHGERVFELTETHVITEAGIDAQAAYDLALHAKLNPKLAEEGVSMLPGNDADRILLYFAAQAFGLKVNNADELTEEQKANPPQEWLAFLASLEDHPSPEAEPEDQPQEPTQEEADTDDAGYEASDQEAEAEAETKPEPEQEPEMTQGVSMDNHPIEATERYGQDYYNETYPAPKQINYSVGAYDPEEAAKIPTLTDVVEEPTEDTLDDTAPETQEPKDNVPEDVTEEAPNVSEPETGQTEAAAEQPETTEVEEETEVLALPAPADVSTEPEAETTLSAHETEEAVEAVAAEDNTPEETQESPELTAKEVIKAPVSEETMTALFNANVGKKTYMEARKQVINEGKASRSFLRDAFDLTDRQAKAVQACLRDENIIAKEGSNKHTVLIQPS